jgi:hypothetical protein
LLAGNGRRLDRHGAARIVRRVTRRVGIAKPVGPHTLRHALITAALDAGVPLRDVQETASHADPRTTLRQMLRAPPVGAAPPQRLTCGLGLRALPDNRPAGGRSRAEKAFWRVWLPRVMPISASP